MTIIGMAVTAMGMIVAFAIVGNHDGRLQTGEVVVLAVGGAVFALLAFVLFTWELPLIIEARKDEIRRNVHDEIDAAFDRALGKGWDD